MGSVYSPVSSSPPRRPVTPIDYIAGCATIASHVSALCTPPTPSWVFFRRAIAFPLVSACYWWSIWVPIHPTAEDQWGVTCLLLGLQMRLIDHIFFVPEQSLHRLRGDPATTTLLPEPVPEAWTMSKAYWALSLFSSWRGIGWNYAAPLSAKASRHPYTRTSSPRSFVLHHTWVLCSTIVVGKATERWMHGPGRAFFSAEQTYATSSRTQVVGHSSAVVARVWWVLNVSYSPLAIACVAWGGYAGWTGEFWEPWGWPPIFGGIGEIWAYPGLSTVWSRSWNNGGRRWFYAVGWVGIGEKILRLPRSGISPHSHNVDRPRLISPLDKMRSGDKSGSTPHDATPRGSRDVTPSHPFPTSTTSTRIPPVIASSNLLKSTIAFTLSGLLHDSPAPSLHLNRSPKTTSLPLGYRDSIYTTPFFAIQPLASAAEASIKRRYRSWKVSRGIARGSEHPASVFAERSFSFVVVWTWSFWCSGWYVSGVGRMGVYASERVHLG